MHKITNQISRDQHALTQFVPEEVRQDQAGLRSAIGERNNYSRRFEKYVKLQKFMSKEKPHTKQKGLKKNHFFEYYAIQEPIFEMEEKPITETQEDRMDSNTVSPHPGDISPLRHTPKPHSKNGSFFNNFGTNKTKVNLVNNFQIVNEKNEESSASRSLKQIELSKCGKINSTKSAVSEKNSKITKMPAPIQVISTSKDTRTLNRADVIDIGGYKYRKKYNTEYKMQLRRKSCCCRNCGQCTNFENKHQNIVNDILIRRNRHFTKIVKVVNFLNKMNRTFKFLPDEDSKSPVKQPVSPKEEVTSLGLIEHHETKAVIEETRAKFQKIAGAFEQAALPDVQGKEKQNKRKGQRKSMTICVRNTTLNKKPNLQMAEGQNQEMKLIEEDNGFSQKSIKIEGQNELGISKSNIEQPKRKSSISLSVVSEDECSLRKMTFQRSKIKQRSLSQFQKKDQDGEKNSGAKERHNQFLLFVENKIKEAKKRRQQKEAKYVGKTPLNVLCRLLSQGKRDSVFDNTQSQKRIQMLIQSKSIHSNTSKAQNAQMMSQQNQFVIRSNNSSRNKHRNSSQNNNRNDLSGSSSASQIQLKASSDECYEQFNQNEPQIPAQPLSFFHKKHQVADPLKEREQNFILTHSQRTVTSPLFISRKATGFKQISPLKSQSQQNEMDPSSNGSDSTKNLLKNNNDRMINSSQENRRNSNRKGQQQSQIPAMSLELRHCRTSKELFRRTNNFPASTTMSRRTPEKQLFQQHNQTQNPWYSSKGQENSSRRITTSANIMDQSSFIISSARMPVKNISEPNKFPQTSHFVVVSPHPSNPSRPGTNQTNNLLNRSAMNSHNTLRKTAGLYKPISSPKIKFPLDNTSVSSPKFAPYLHQLFYTQKETSKQYQLNKPNSSQSQRIKSPQSLRFQSNIEQPFQPSTEKNTKPEES